jgi:DNA-binding NarL/FixJ family response regulator
MHATELATKTSVSILSHSRLFRETIAAWLKLQDQIRWVATAGSVHQLLDRLNGRATDVLLAHARIDGVLGTELVWDAKTLLPATHLIVLGFRQSEQDLVRWIEAGAMAYLEHDASPAELLETIRDVSRGRPGCSMSLLTRAIEGLGHMTCKAAQSDGPPRAEPISDRELEIAIRLPSGLLNEPIGRQLGIKAIHGEDSTPVHARAAPGTATA